jgi:Zn-dependent metalloprotease
MALQLADRVQQTGIANTTVSFSLTGAVTGFQSFSSAITTGNTTYYSSTDTSGNWEVGIGTLTSTTLLTRTTILASSNSGSAVTFSGTVTVFVTYPSERSVNLDQSTNTAIAPQFNASNGLLLNNATVSTSYTVATGTNAISVGPMTIASGISITVASGQRWVIL